MARLFGTDGVRGLANADLTPALALRLATSAARVLAIEPADPLAAGGHRRPRAVVGRDPRASGEMLEAAVAAGLASAGVDVVLLGVLPTPGVAYLTSVLEADLGVVISASHNAMPDNGIKIFGAGGHKLADQVEDAIEAGMDATAPLPTGERVGRISDHHDAVDRYVDHLLVSIPHSLSGIKVVVDCAHGASSAVAPEVYRRAGAEVIVIAGEPDGLNINDGVGSTYLQGLRAAVLAHGADLGIAHDGDADRCLAVDSVGVDVGGDAILALLALAMQERGELNYGTVVTTVMANLGFHHAMTRAGLTVKTTAVGDRYVLAEMNAGGYSLGGEQSGHIVMSEHATTGDGLLTATHLMARMASTGISLSNLAKVVTMLPQMLVNVRVADKAAVAESGAVRAAVDAARTELGDSGRVLLRPSGTEPMVRVMVEGPTEGIAQSLARRVADTVEFAGRAD